MSITSDLSAFYDAEAAKYAQTRKKPRKEGKRIFAAIKRVKSKIKTGNTMKILELGCGSGRFVQQKDFEEMTHVQYTGVDVSKGLLAYAKKSYPDGTFVHKDMLGYMKTQKQESVDIISAFASFQHIASREERELLMHHFYAALRYGGKLIMTNWAYSSWFRNKYSAACKTALLKFLWSAGRHSFRDIYVPWKGKNKQHKRYYHMFGLKEIKQLCQQAGFQIEALEYMDKAGQAVKHAKYANNSILIAKKDVYDNSLAKN